MFEWLKRSKNRERDIDEELKCHIEMLAEDQVDRGVASDEATFRARRKLGNATAAKESTRAVWIMPALDSFSQDVRYALRTLRKSPAFALTAVLSLALGIGANTAIFSLINALLVRMLPVHDPQQLVQLVTGQKEKQISSFPYPAIKTLEQSTDLFSGVCGFSSALFNAGPHGAVQSTSGAWVTGMYYQTLGVEAELGRLLTPDDDKTAGTSGLVTVLSYSYWDNKFHRNPDVIGKQILIDGAPVTIIGVSARGFDGAQVGTAANITLPVAALPLVFPERLNFLNPGAWWLRVFARPKPGISLTQVKAQLQVIWPGITKQLVSSITHADARKDVLSSRVDAIPGSTGWSQFRGSFTGALILVMSLVGVVLIVACVNVANLLLARTAARAREIEVRLAIGASRWRLIRQFLNESMLLACLGASLGILLAYAADQLLISLFSSPLSLPVVLDVHPDARVLGFTIAVTLLSGVLFGLAPAFRGTASTGALSLKEVRPHGSRRSWLASSLVVSQVALSLLLLFGAGLFVRTLQNLRNISTGFQQEGILLVSLDARHAGYKDARLVALYNELLQGVQRIPGVREASLSWNTPLSGLASWDSVLIDGRQPLGTSVRDANLNYVSPGYFATLRTPLLLGRDFNSADNAASQPVAIVNENFIKDFLKDQNPVGRRVSMQYSPHHQNMQICRRGERYNLLRPHAA